MIPHSLRPDRATAIVALVVLLAPAAATAEEIACPAEIVTPAAAEAHPGWRVVPRPSPTGFPFRGPERPGRNALAGIAVVDGPDSDVMAPAPGTLMPDEGASGRPRPPRLTQRWDISGGSPRGLLLVCQYRGTATVLARVLPPDLRECRQVLPVDPQGRLSDRGSVTASCR